MLRRSLVPVYLSLLSLLTAGCAWAQFDAATVLGTVTDPSGAVVPGSRVLLHNNATGTEMSANADGRGEYRFVGVPVGPYRIEASAAGFQTVRTAFELEVGARQRVDLRLAVASVTVSVAAATEPRQIETESSDHSQVITDREIAALPLNGRNYSQLVELAAGVIPSAANQPTSTYNQREGSFNINGLRSVFSNYLLDGLDNNFYGTSNQGFSNQVVQLPPDSVDEFRVVMNNESAEYGRSAGATINVVTRYGTNQLHGRVWEFLRNTDLNAAGFFRPDSGGKPALNRNQFGGNLGGPIRHNRLFFFLDYEGYRQSSSFTDQATIPTLSERGLSGTGAPLGYVQIDDTDAASPYHILPIDNPCPYNGTNPCNSVQTFGAGLGEGGIQVQQALGGTQYLNGQIPTTAITPFAQALLAALPAPTDAGTLNNYRILHPQSYDKDKGDAKIDWAPSQSLRLFVRYSQSRLDAFDPGTLPGLAGGDGDGHVYAPMLQVASGATWTINPVSILEARFGFSRMKAGKSPVLAGGPSMQQMFGIGGLPTDPAYTGGVTYQYFLDGGFTNLGRQWTNPQYQNPTVWDPKVNYTRLLPRHTLKAGVEYNQMHVAQEDLHPVMGANAYDAQISGYCYYNGCYAAIDPNLAGAQTPETFRMFDYADFLFGYQAEMGLASPTISALRTWGWAGYLQDDWKVNNRLTLNLGLRYEFFTPIAEAQNQMANFDPATQSLVVASSHNRYLVNPNTEDLGPRIGAAFSLNPRTALRAGYGISYAHWNRVGSNYLTMNPPFGVVAQREAYPSLAAYQNTQSGFPANMVNPANYNPLEDALQYMPASSPDTQVRSWFAGVQRELGDRWMVDLSYVGNYGLHEILINDINQAPAGGTTPLAQRVPNPAFGSVIGTLPWAYSNFNGLEARVEKQYSGGLYLLNSFTWSKAIDIAEQALDGGGNCSDCGNAIPSVQDIYHWQADRAPAGFNYPFINVTSLTWSLPVGRGRALLSHAGRLSNLILGGWQTTDILQMHSGDPLTFAYSPGNSNEVSALITVDGRNAYRPDQTGPAVHSGKSYLQYLNTASFSTPQISASNTDPFGNSPRNAVRGYAFYQLDTGLTKSFNLTERSRLEVHGDAFNLFNHTNFGDPNTLEGSPFFGVITSASPARELQVSAKILF